jgi:UDP-N-acetylmuramate dehydrogenase
MTRVQQLLQDNFQSLDFVFDYPLSERSYFKIGGRAEVFYSVTDERILQQLTTFCAAEQIRCTILGGGSNVIIADAGLEGLVLHIDLQGLDFLAEDEQHLRLRVAAGVKTAVLVAKAASRGGAGLEGFIGVPGTVGGAIYNNAHYLNDLIADHIESVHAFDSRSSQVVELSKAECNFAYEHSNFQEQKHLVILSAVFDLPKGDPITIKERIRESKERRERKQPLNMPSCGCVFQNPPNTEQLKQLFPQFVDFEFIPAGFLIQEAGLKGTRVGGIEVSDKHAAFFVNTGAGKASDVKELVSLVKARVKERFGVELKEEVFYLN